MGNNKNIYNPKSITLLSLIIGYALIGDLSSYEQNAFGNFLMTIGQILEANSAIQQVQEAKISNNNLNINSKQYKNGGSPYENKTNDDNNNELNFIKKEIAKIMDELNRIKKT